MVAHGKLSETKKVEGNLHRTSCKRQLKLCTPACEASKGSKARPVNGGNGNWGVSKSGYSEPKAGLVTFEVVSDVI